MTKTPTPKRHMMTASKEASSPESMGSVADTVKIFYPNETNALPTTIRTSSGECINERELHSIYALFAYVAYNQNVAQETVQMIVEAQFGVDHVAKIRRADYMRAIEFLVDLKMDEVVN